MKRSISLIRCIKSPPCERVFGIQSFKKKGKNCPSLYGVTVSYDIDLNSPRQRRQKLDRDFSVYKSDNCKCTVVSCSFKRYQIHRDYESIYRYLRLLCKARSTKISIVPKGK